MEGYQPGEGEEGGATVQDIRSVIHRHKEAKEFLCTIHGHEIKVE